MKNPRVSRRKEMFKNQGRKKCKRNSETTAKINKAKSWIFEKINKIDKPLATLIKKKRKLQTNITEELRAVSGVKWP